MSLHAKGRDMAYPPHVDSLLAFPDLATTPQSATASVAQSCAEAPPLVASTHTE